MSSDYRLAPQFAARLLGIALIGLGGLVFLTTMLVVLLRVPVEVLLVVVVACIVGLFVLGAQLTRRMYVVRLTDDGYQVRLVRGAGVRRARWSDVEEVATDTVAGSPCLIIRLKGGDSTTIPVEVLAGDREEFVREVSTHLIGR